MLGNPSFHVLIKLLTLNLKLFMIPPQLLKIKINQIRQRFFLLIHAPKNQHILGHQDNGMTPPRLNILLIIHLNLPIGKTIQINQRYRIKTTSTLPT